LSPLFFFVPTIFADGNTDAFAIRAKRRGPPIVPKILRLLNPSSDMPDFAQLADILGRRSHRPSMFFMEERPGGVARGK
jgi:hypothetical protein